MVCMNIETTLTKFGFVRQEYDFQLQELLRSYVKLKEVHIDIYPENPLTSSNTYMLLLRTTEKNASIVVEDNRVIFKRNDTQETLFVNVLIPKIKECFSKISENYSEFILNVQTIYYKITILN